MMTTKFTPDHEYIRVEGSVGIVGITPYAQEQLGDIVFVDLPSVGKVLKKGDEAAVVESVKAASEIYAPVAGTIVEVNSLLTTEPGLVNTDPENGGWMFKIELSDAGELNTLLDADGYADLTL
jgi:glycine cleavage system H protein